MDINTKDWLIGYSKDCKWEAGEELKGVPTVLTEPYRQLGNLAKSGNVYGVLMQLKDVFELILKIPALMSIIILETAKDTCESDAYGTVIRKLLQKPLSMGDWKDLAATIVKYEGDGIFPESLIKILKKTVLLYDTAQRKGMDIIGWRNAEIGHGTLRFEDDGKYLKDFEFLLPLLDSYFAGKEAYSITGLYEGVEIRLSEESEAYDMALYVSGREYKTAHYVDTSSPYSFFNSYKSASLICQYSPCIEGGIKSVHSEYFAELYRRFAGVPVSDGSTFTGKRKTYNYLESLNTSYDYVKPKKLFEELEARLEGKGVIGLFMERGTGKSSLANRLSNYNHSDSKAPFKNATVRCFHLAKASLLGVSSFVNFLNREFPSFFDAAEDIMDADVEIPTISLKSSDPAGDMAEFLNTYRELYLRSTGREKLVLILDGVDELNDKASGILKFIPGEDMLDENVFIVLTSRFEDEETVEGGSRARIEALKKIVGGNTLEVRRDSDINVDAMKQYLRSVSGKNGLTEEAVDDLLEAADNRFLYLRTCYLINNRTKLNTHDEEAFIRSYMEYLFSISPLKQQMRIKEIAASFALFPGITLPICRDYVNCFDTTPEYMGPLNDIASLLTVSHRDGEDAYEFANEAFTRFVLTEYKDAVKSVIESFFGFLAAKIGIISEKIKESDIFNEDYVEYRKMNFFCDYALDELKGLAESYDYIREIVAGGDRFGTVIEEFPDFGVFALLAMKNVQTKGGVDTGKMVEAMTELVYLLGDFRDKVCLKDQESADSFAGDVCEPDDNEATTCLKYIRYDGVVTYELSEAPEQFLTCEKECMDLIAESGRDAEDVYGIYAKPVKISRETRDEYVGIIGAIAESEISLKDILFKNRAEQEFHVYMSDRLKNLEYVAKMTGDILLYRGLSRLYDKYLNYLLHEHCPEEACEVLWSYVSGADRYNAFLDILPDIRLKDFLINRAGMDKFMYCSENALWLLLLLYEQGEKVKLSQFLKELCEGVPASFEFYGEAQGGRLLSRNVYRLAQFCEFIGYKPENSLEEYFASEKADTYIDTIKRELTGLSYNTDIDNVYHAIYKLTDIAYYTADYEIFASAREEISEILEREKRSINDTFAKWMQDVKKYLDEYDDFFDFLKEHDKVFKDESLPFIWHRRNVYDAKEAYKRAKKEGRPLSEVMSRFVFITE